MIYAQLLQLGITFLTQFIGSITTNKAPQEVIDAAAAALAAIQAHYDDVMSKGEWEALRG